MVLFPLQIGHGDVSNAWAKRSTVSLEQEPRVVAGPAARFPEGSWEWCRAERFVAGSFNEEVMVDNDGPENVVACLAPSTATDTQS